MNGVEYPMTDKQYEGMLKDTIACLDRVARNTKISDKPWHNYQSLLKCRNSDLISKNIENIHVVTGIDLVPHDKMLFGDLRIHPDDNGFEYYANSLLRKLSKEISI